MTIKPQKEPFLTRWSKRKQEAREEEAREKPKTETSAAQQPGTEEKRDGQSRPLELPPIEKLDYDSDYRAFLDPRVDEDTRRAALKKLFADARFNVIDEMDIYIDDYTKSDPIPPAMLASLKQARNILEWAKGGDEQAGRSEHDRTAQTDAAPELPSGDGGSEPLTGAPPPVPAARDESGPETGPDTRASEDPASRHDT